MERRLESGHAASVGERLLALSPNSSGTRRDRSLEIGPRDSESAIAR
jgi:hypothetical protein